MKPHLVAVILSTAATISGLVIPQSISCQLFPEGLRGYNCLEHSCYIWSRNLHVKMEDLTTRPFDRLDLKLLCMKHPDVLEMPNGEAVERYLNFPYRLAGEIAYGVLGSDEQYTPGTVPEGAPGATFWPFESPNLDTPRDFIDHDTPPLPINW